MRIPHISIRLFTVLVMAFLVAVIYFAFRFSSILSEATQRERLVESLYTEATRKMVEENTNDELFEYLWHVKQATSNCTPVLIMTVDKETGQETFCGDCFKLSESDSLDIFGPKATDKSRQRVFDKFRNYNHSVTIELTDDIHQVLYFGQSEVAENLMFVALAPVMMIALVVLVVMLIIVHKRREEREGIWQGLCRETAHQLGTPISALGAWRDLLEIGYDDTAMMAREMTRDIDRLKTVSERFSKIGSAPVLTSTDIRNDVESVVTYLQSRVAKNVKMTFLSSQEEIAAPHEPNLLRWAVENICKNAADAIDPAKGGSITVSLHRSSNQAFIDISDTGAGMDPKTARRIFAAGFSTKKRGWGIGLALVRRIVEQYHHGKVFVLKSQPGVGTTFRICLPITD